MTNTFTKKDFFKAVIAAAEVVGDEIFTFTNKDGDEVVISNDDIVAFANREIDRLAAKVEKAKAAAKKKKAEHDELKDVVQSVLDPDNFKTIAEVAAVIQGEDVTVSKITYRLTQLVEDGIAVKDKVTVGEEGKRRKVMGYKLAAGVAPLDHVVEIDDGEETDFDAEM